jgi:hypothetical protein
VRQPNDDTEIPGGPDYIPHAMRRELPRRRFR